MTLLAIDVKLSDFEWTPVAETPAPAVVQTVHAPEAAPTLISAEELDARMKLYVERILADPAWHEEQRRKQEEKAAKRIAREARLAERRQRRTAAK